MDEETSELVHSGTIGGYTGGRRTRCTDKFVRYPYPATLLSGYQKDFKEKLKKTVGLLQIFLQMITKQKLLTMLMQKRY